MAIVANVAEKQAIVVNLDVAALSGETQIDFHKLGVVVEELPDSSRKLLKAATLPDSFVECFQQLRNKAHGILSRGQGAISTPLGVVMSRAEALGRLTELKAIKEQWLQSINTAKAVYEEVCESHLTVLRTDLLGTGATDEQVDLLITHVQKRQPSWAEMERKLRFGYTASIVALEEEGFDPDFFEAQLDGVTALKQGVMASALQWVSSEAAALLKVLDGVRPNQKTGEMAVNVRSTDRAKAIAERLDSLSFIHAQLGMVGAELKGAFAHFNGAMPAGVFSDFRQCLRALRDPLMLAERLERGEPLILRTAQQQAAPASQLPLTATPAPAEEEVAQEDGSESVEANALAKEEDQLIELAPDHSESVEAPAETETVIQPAVVQQQLPQGILLF